jgi:hypothetical protein
MIDMTDVSSGVLSPEDARIQQAADNAVRVLNGEQAKFASAKRRLADALRIVTREAPLHSLVIAFLLGVLIAKRR